MPSSRYVRQSIRTVGAVVVVGAVLAAGVLAGAALADGHTESDAPYYENGNGSADATVFLPEDDRRAGARDVDVRYTLKGDEAFTDVGMGDGVDARWFDVEAAWLDHGDCNTENVVVFGIDRGDNDSGSQVDVDLVRHTKWVAFHDDGITVEFYEWADFGGDPPQVYPEDRIVLELGDESAGGACVDATRESGRYTADVFLNGTDVGSQNSSGETRGFVVETNETHLEPNQGTPIPTETTTPTSTPTPTERPRTPTPDGTPILTATVNESVGDATVSADASVDDDGVSANASVDAAGPGGGAAAVDPPSPTPGDGPGFGASVAVLTLLGTSLLARRRPTRESG